MTVVVAVAVVAVAVAVVVVVVVTGRSTQVSVVEFHPQYSASAQPMEEANRLQSG